jgi:pimeloyl-ACP methyl ester carboxylesterase
VKSYRGYVGSAGAQVHYRRCGDAGPVLVLLHESPQASNVFEPALTHLGKRLQPVALDTPGYGMSDPPAAPLEIPQYAQLLLGAIDELGIDTFAVAGQHTGASLAIEVARLAGPRRVSRLLLSGLVHLTPEERAEFLSGWAPDKPFSPDGSHLGELWERYIGLWEEPAELLNLSVTNIAAILPRYHWAYNAAFRYDPAPALAELDAQIMLLTASRDMLAHLDDRATALRPDATRMTLTDSTGQLPWRVPETYARVVGDFITRQAGKAVVTDV